MRKFLSVFMVLGLVLLFISQEAWADSAKIQNPDNGHYYQRIDTTMNWHAAKAYCESIGGYLVTVTSEGEHNFVYDNLVSNSPQFCWLGGTDEAEEGTWEWITGEPWSYTHWAEGEPNNCSGIEHYLTYSTPSGPRQDFWNDLGSCNDRGCGCGGYNESVPMSTICEWDSLTVERLIDIYPDTLNLKSKGKWITGYIELPEDWDVEDVDVTTILLNGEVAAAWADVQYCPENKVLMVKFFRDEVQAILAPGDAVEITITGELLDGTAFEGGDIIRVK
jgi:hypothetical protein